MKRKICLILTMLMILSSFASTAFAADINKDKFESDLEFMRNVIYFVTDYYQYEVDQEDILDGLYDGFFSVLDDYSVYYTPNEYQAMLDTTAGEYTGIGVQIIDHNSQILVITPLTGSPALEAGIKSGDIIKYVDDADITGLTISQAASLIQGKEGTHVKLGIIRGTEKINFDIIRKTILTSTVEGKILDENTGYLKVTDFSDNTVELVKKELNKFDESDIKKLVIDMRNNGGGTLNSAVDMLNLFVTEGPVVYVDYATGKEDIYESELKEQKYEIAVLINGGSASATEVFAGAVKYKNEGIIVGTQSFGKGIVQTLYPLKNGSGVKFTTAEYFSVDRTPVHKVGVAPDIEVENKKTDLSIYPQFSKTKKSVLGSVSLDVLAAEMILDTLGYDVDEPDGVYDSKSYEQIVKFQQDNYLYAYGSIDITTQNTLYSALVNYTHENTDDLQLKAAIEALNK
ncbi:MULTISPECIES: S41 family peptidase [unclassified Sedimentibacter]|uniref:S41 family peptidase n=1 Tax=unclassified Sedimentibacter TaxID=2649220 RepID=UPI0027E0BB5E|nr:S41 family peptidase [Sedimentibacter sp. MB35-C1]WMJ77635.1 S41 family peptidase [Sedimentibacter sp. MB35-C1]